MHKYHTYCAIETYQYKKIKEKWKKENNQKCMSMVPNIGQENCQECKQELYQMDKRQLKQV